MCYTVIIILCPTSHSMQISYPSLLAVGRRPVARSKAQASRDPLLLSVGVKGGPDIYASQSFQNHSCCCSCLESPGLIALWTFSLFTSVPVRSPRPPFMSLTLISIRSRAFPVLKLLLPHPNSRNPFLVRSSWSLMSKIPSILSAQTVPLWGGANGNSTPPEDVASPCPCAHGLGQVGRHLPCSPWPLSDHSYHISGNAQLWIT